ncbi:MAG: aspartyl/asparaginyl beta-hydroxylase domain-containing protein, partial [Steroidobacteraceae bacterium]
ENAPLFPDTLAALDLAPMPHIPRQAPMALFSKLAPRTRIPPHTGLLNTRLICHLPLVVPPDCGALRVGNEAHPWVEGEMLIFDDSIEHEAWNDSDQERVVLLFEVWRPEISAEERAMLTVLLRVVKEQASQGQAPKD